MQTDTVLEIYKIMAYPVLLYKSESMTLVTQKLKIVEARDME